MDDLTNSFNNFVTSDDYCSHTNLASNIHPRLLDYKKKSNTKSASQEVRRRQVLEEQKRKRTVLVEQSRNVIDEKHSTRKHEKESDTENKSKKSTYKKAPFNLMFSEWLDEIPYDFETNWIMCLCPIGKRCLVVASEGSTIIYNKAGKIIYKHKSKLPGGCNESKIDYTILDCVYNETSRTYFVLDCLCWKSHPILETETEFRFYWLKCKLDETPEVKRISFENPYKFADIPRYYECKREIIETALKENVSFEFDGILFYHKETHYTCNHTPLVGWLKPYMLPEILNIQVPKSILETAPNDYTNAKSTIFNSNIEIERFKNYLCSKTIEDQSDESETPVSTATYSPVKLTYSTDVNQEYNDENLMDVQNKSYHDNSEIEQ